MKNFKRFANFEDDYILTIYRRLSVIDKISLWSALLVDNMIFNSSENALDLFTVENYTKWKSVEKDIDEYLEKLMEDFWDHGPWSKGVNLQYVRKEINKRLGKYMKHDTKIKRYQGTLNELVTDIGDLRYDALSNFLSLLSDKLKRDGDKDFERGRVNLAKQLHGCADDLKQSKAKIDEAWRISKPFMDI